MTVEHVTGSSSSGAKRVRGKVLETLRSRAVIGDRFRVLRELGRGAHGRVYLAHDPVMDRHVALKVTRGESVDGVLDEARACARLRHPNVVEVYEVGAADGHVWMAMEWLEGETLSQWLQRRPSLVARLATLVQLAEGLDAVHRGGLVHRDVKPSNVIVTNDGRAVLADFGLASTDAMRETGPVGTRGYWAPEVEAGGAAGPRSDQFSFARVLEHAGLGRLAARGLRREPAKRWSSMRALVRWLRAWLLAAYAFPVLAMAIVVSVGLLGQSPRPIPSEEVWGGDAMQIGRMLSAAQSGRSGEAYDVWTSLEGLRARHPAIAGAAASSVAERIKHDGREDHYFAAWMSKEGARLLARAERWEDAAALRVQAARHFERVDELQAAAIERRCAHLHARRQRC